jgi:outer membrane immunogenic protein
MRSCKVEFLFAAALIGSSFFLSSIAEAQNYAYPSGSDYGRSKSKAASVSAAKPEYNWSGWYIGGTAGWGWRHENTYPSQSYYESLGANFAGGAGYGGTSGSGASKHDGFTASVDFGYNIQFQKLVFGIDYEFLYANVANSPSYGQSSFSQGSGRFPTIYTALNYDTADGDSNKWYGVLRGKVGVALDRFFPYVTGGAAYRLSYSTTDPTVITYTYDTTTRPATYISSTRTYSGINSANAWGWVLGGGIEYAVTDPLLLRVEYLHFDFGEDTYLDPVASALTNSIVTLGFKRTIDLVRFGVSYRFTPGYRASSY